MANLAGVLKDEIRRLARKETKSEIGVTRRASAQHRRDIAELKRLVSNLSKRVAFLERQEKRRVAERSSKESAEGIRFSPRWLKGNRERLGISAADYGTLVGVSSLTIYNWEGGKAKPSKNKLAALAAVRGLGKREALKRLEMLAG